MGFERIPFVMMTNIGLVPYYVKVIIPDQVRGQALLPCLTAREKVLISEAVALSHAERLGEDARRAGEGSLVQPRVAGEDMSRCCGKLGEMA